MNGSKQIIEEFTKSYLNAFMEKINLGVICFFLSNYYFYLKNSQIIAKAYAITETLMQHFFNKEESNIPLNFVNCAKVLIRISFHFK